MSSRAEVEQSVVDDESLLDQVIGLLEGRCELGAWPEAARAALALALQDGSMSRTEGWKAVVLRRHLFGPVGDVPERLETPAHPSVNDQRRGERLRGGLPACVSYRAGAYLLQRSR